MKKRKAAVILSAIIMIFSLNTVTAKVDAEDKLPCIYPECGYAGENEITEVSVKFDSETDISAFSIEIVFNPEMLDFIEAEKGSAVKSGTFYYNTYSEDSVKLVWSDSKDSSIKGTAAKLSFKTKHGTAEKEAGVFVGRCILGNENYEEVQFETENSFVKIYRDYVMGDASGDGVTNSSDVIVVNKNVISENKYPISSENKINADADCDGVISSKDCTKIINHILGMGR